MSCLGHDNIGMGYIAALCLRSIACRLYSHYVALGSTACQATAGTLRRMIEIQKAREDLVLEETHGGIGSATIEPVLLDEACESCLRHINHVLACEVRWAKHPRAERGNVLLLKLA